MGDSKTFNEVAQMYVAHHALYSRSRQTAESQVHVLSKHFGGRSWESITRDDIRAFVTERREKDEATGATINRNLAALGKMGTLHGSHNPAHGFPRFKEIQGRTVYLSPEHAQRLINAAADHLKPLLWTALMTGARRGELLALTWADVDLEAGVIWFRSHTTKAQRERMVPMAHGLADVLRTIGPGKPVERVFQFRGKGIGSIRTAFDRARKKAGLGPEITFHITRHTWASWSAMNGVDEARLMAYAGWSSTSLAKRYRHLSPEYLRDGARFFGPPSDVK